MVSEERNAIEDEMDFAQRLFEQHWIVEMARGAVYPPKEGQTEMGNR
jgi:hypothetical protein